VKRALITGATGFLGSRIARKLCARDIAVRALVRKASERRRIADLPIEMAEGDVTDRASIERACEGVDRVFHVAAVYEIGARDPARMEATNVGGTRNVLAAAATRGIFTVYTSSTVALGPTANEPADETHWGGGEPHSPYEATKRKAHEIARSFEKTTAIALPVTIYGPDDPSLVGQAHRWFARGRLRVASFADLKMTLVHVDDCAEAHIRMAERAQPGEELIIAGQVVTFREWFEALARVSGHKPPRFVPAWMARAAGPVGAALAPLAGFRGSTVREGLAMSAHWAFSGQRARQTLDWQPRSLDDGLSEVMAYYRSPKRIHKSV
jgi:dihydroflavonol-4-reductase